MRRVGRIKDSYANPRHNFQEFSQPSIKCKMRLLKIRTNLKCHNYRVYILSSKQTNWSMRARVVAQLFHKEASKISRSDKKFPWPKKKEKNPVRSVLCIGPLRLRRKNFSCNICGVEIVVNGGSNFILIIILFSYTNSCHFLSV